MKAIHAASQDYSNRFVDIGKAVTICGLKMKPSAAPEGQKSWSSPVFAEPKEISTCKRCIAILAKEPTP